MSSTDAPANAVALSSGPFSLPLDVTDYILSVVFYSLVARYSTPSALWDLAVATSTVKFKLMQFYALRLVNRLWRDIIDAKPTFWTFFPLSQLSPSSFSLLQDRCVRVIEDGRRIGPNLTVIVSDAVSLGYFLQMILARDQERIEVLQLWMDRQCWITAIGLLERTAFPILRLASFGYRKKQDLDMSWGVDDGWGVGWGAQPVVPGGGWNDMAVAARGQTRTEALSYYVSPLFQKLSSCIQTTTLCLGQDNFITRRFDLPAVLTTLHIRYTEDDVSPSLMRFSHFTAALRSLPSLAELELWRVGFDLDEEPSPIHHSQLRRLAIMCSTASLHALFSYLRHCHLDLFVLELKQEGRFDISVFTPSVFLAVSLFTSYHVVKSVGIQWIGSSLVWGSPGGKVEMYLRAEDDLAFRLTVPFSMAKIHSSIMDNCVPAGLPLSVSPAPYTSETDDLYQIVSRIPWSRFPHIRLLDVDTATDTIVNQLLDDSNIHSPVLVVLHREQGDPLQWHGGMAFRAGFVRVDFLMDPGCCRPSRDDRLKWTSLSGQIFFSSPLHGPLHHLWRMMDF